MVRFKNRYLLLELDPKNRPKDLKPLSIKQNIIFKIIKDKIIKLHGAYGYGQVRESLLVKYCNEELGIILIRARRGPHNYVLSCIPTIKSIAKKDVTLKCLYIGATIRCCLKFLLKYQQTRLAEDWRSIQGDPKQKILCRKLLERAKIQPVL